MKKRKVFHYRTYRKYYYHHHCSFPRSFVHQRLKRCQPYSCDSHSADFVPSCDPSSPCIQIWYEYKCSLLLLLVCRRIRCVIRMLRFLIRLFDAQQPALLASRVLTSSSLPYSWNRGRDEIAQPSLYPLQGSASAADGVFLLEVDSGQRSRNGGTRQGVHQQQQAHAWGGRRYHRSVFLFKHRPQYYYSFLH